MVKFDKKNIVRLLIQVGIIIAILVLVPLTISLSKGGFDEPEVAQQFYFYEITGIGFLFGILILLILEIFITKGDTKYGNGNGFYLLGEKPSFSFFKRFTRPQITMLFFIGFSIIFLVSISLVQQGIIQSSTFTGVQVLPQQFTSVDSLLFSSALIPTSENLGAAFVICLTLFIIRRIARKNNWSFKKFLIVSLISVPIITGIFGLAWHLWRYSGSEVALRTVWFFWTLGGFLTIATGLYFIFWAMHGDNNFFYDIARFFSKEQVFIFVIIGIFLLIGLYALIYKGRLFGERKPKQEEV